MKDSELAEFIAPNETSENKLKLVTTLRPEQRALFEHMADVYDRIRLYEAGLGPKPMDAIVCGPSEIREGRGPRQTKKKRHR